MVVEEIQSLHQEKRTALKAIRMGVAVILAQISAIGFLATAFRNHAFFQAMPYKGALAVLAVFLLGISIYLVVYPLIRIRRLNRKILKLTQKRIKIIDLPN